jgi:DNA polymerase
MKIENYKRATEASTVQEFCKGFEEGCSRCSLSVHMKKALPVIYRGNPEAKIVLIGEAPGAEEYKCGKPFTGPAGEQLDKLMAGLGINTDRDLFITNVAYCRPEAPKGSGKQNYTPRKDQVAMCFPFTRKLIDIVKPLVIIACGGTAAKELLDDATATVGGTEGRWFHYGDDAIPLFVMRHPAAWLHLSDKPKEQFEMKKMVWEYMKTSGLKEILETADEVDSHSCC